MTRIEWNKAGERFFEAGINQGVLYPSAGAGVPWNGLISVGESSSGGDLEPLYFEGVKYLDVASSEDFSADVSAFSSPPEFDVSDGTKTLVPGLFVTQQPRKRFGLSYRTMLGNDLVGVELGYKLHIVYNCTAGPSSRNYQTLGSNVVPGTRSWKIETVPPASSTFKPSAHLVVDSTKVVAAKLASLENALYGTAAAAPYLPTVAQVVGFLD